MKCENPDCEAEGDQEITDRTTGIERKKFVCHDHIPWADEELRSQ